MILAVDHTVKIEFKIILNSLAPKIERKNEVYRKGNLPKQASEL